MSTTTLLGTVISSQFNSLYVKASRSFLLQSYVANVAETVSMAAACDLALPMVVYVRWSVYVVS